MDQYIAVAEEENEEPIELPIEDDGTLLLTTLSAQFPGACGLKYRNKDTGNFRGVRVVDGRLASPDGHWQGYVYIVVFPKAENKRKGDEAGACENPLAKTKRLMDTKCTDLIVLGLPWKSTEDDLKSYFIQFGELMMVQVKKDLKTGQSKGFGFVRFEEYESQTKCLSQRHLIDGRWCDVRIPNSKEGAIQQNMNRKVFVGRCTEDITADDLRAYFSKIGEVVDVFIPKPFRAFAFVTFADPEVAQALCGEDHIIKNASVHISSAAPKSVNDKTNMALNQRYTQQGGPPSQGGYNNGQGYGQGNGQGYNNQGNWGGNKGNGGPPGNMGGGNPGNPMGNMNNPMGMGGLFQLNPAMVAAAQAALGQAGWGAMLGNLGGQGGGDGQNQMQGVPQNGQGMPNNQYGNKGAQGNQQQNNQQGGWGWNPNQGQGQQQQGGQQQPPAAQEQGQQMAQGGWGQQNWN